MVCSVVRQNLVEGVTKVFTQEQFIQIASLAKEKAGKAQIAVPLQEVHFSAQEAVAYVKMMLAKIVPKAEDQTAEATLETLQNDAVVSEVFTGSKSDLLLAAMMFNDDPEGVFDRHNQVESIAEPIFNCLLAATIEVLSA